MARRSDCCNAKIRTRTRPVVVRTDRPDKLPQSGKARFLECSKCCNPIKAIKGSVVATGP